MGSNTLDPGLRRGNGSGAAGRKYVTPAQAGVQHLSKNLLQLRQLLAQFLQRRGEPSQPLILLRDHSRRCTRNKALIAQLGIGFGDLAFKARHFLVQSFALGGDRCLR